MKRSFIVAAFLWGAIAPSAFSNVEAWGMMDTRVALTEGFVGLPRHLRLFNQYRFGPGYGWFGQALLRVGPIWEPHPNLRVATHMTTSLEQQADRSYRQELRAEFEPTLQWQWGDFEFSDRNRLEHSWFPSSSRWRYRNQIRLAYAPPGWEWRPVVSEEAFWIMGQGLSENRLQLSVMHPTADTDRIDWGYMLRARSQDTGWDMAHVLSMTWFFGPEKEPLFTGPAAD